MNAIADRMPHLWNAIARMDGVAALGYTGDERLELREDGADIDAFVFVRSIPPPIERADAYRAGLGNAIDILDSDAIAGGPWGRADRLIVGGTEVWIMYFRTDETLCGLEATLAGNRLDRENDFFPTGRLAALLTLNVVKDDGFLKRIRERLSVYPRGLRDRMIAFQLPLAYDEEDFASALRRADVWFFHAVLDAAIEHFLQTLFALNDTYFPSRKRNEAHLAVFRQKPDRCAERIHEAIRLGSSEATLQASRDLWVGLVRDLESIVADATGRA